ncbi:MAG: ORF6N domain-containing protein [Bacteroidales bacterium]|nr:ORF6N domain-containing protein [Bacteroidales bacterium]
MIPDEKVMDKIHPIRDKRVMLDRDLAQLYNVETKVLKQAVRRNIDRFPDDFMFELSNEEFTILRSQFVTSKYPNYACFCSNARDAVRRIGFKRKDEK